MFDSVFLGPIALAVLAVAVVAAVALVRVVRARRRMTRRVVERPNSHYTSQLAQHSVTRHRWHNMALDRMHEINREEVVRLLAKVDAVGVDALRADERRFLDYMAELTGTKPPAEPRDDTGQGPRDLRHNPA